jgi:small subunit ribosomal protein S6
MPKYEITFVFDKNLKDLQKKLEGYIKSADGKIVKEEDWGVKPLAYPIKKYDEAKYLYYEVEIDPKQMKALEKQIQLEENLLRSLVVKA